MSKIHVIIPVYNAKRFLREAVDSVLNQPYKDIDIVLVNDGSTDGSDVLCDEIAANEERVSVIHQENGGVSRARNAGIEYTLRNAMDEDYIAFLDADDLWIKNAITADIVQMLQKKDAADLFAFGGFKSTQNGERFCVPFRYEMQLHDGGEHMVWKIANHFCSNIYSLKLFRRYQLCFPNGLKYQEDTIFQMQCVFLAEKLQCVDRLLHIYRDFENSAMHKRAAIPSITYYLPVIDAWVEAEDFLNRWESVTNKHFHTGRVLAGIALMEMAEQHYRQLRSRRELETVLKGHPHYALFERMNPQDVTAKRMESHDMLMKRPRLFQLKHHAIGIVENAERRIMRLRPLRIWWMKRKYPLTQMPTND